MKDEHNNNNCYTTCITYWNKLQLHNINLMKQFQSQKIFYLYEDID